MTTRAAFVVAARTYIGVPWRHGGRSRMGVDCIGLLLCAAWDCGLPADEPPPYAKGARDRGLSVALAGRCLRVPLGEARPGDVLMFADGHYPMHVGLRAANAAGRPTVIHAGAGGRRVAEQPILHQLADALRAAYRLPDLED